MGELKVPGIKKAAQKPKAKTPPRDQIVAQQVLGVIRSMLIMKRSETT